jgi:hypothetical protein
MEVNECIYCATLKVKLVEYPLLTLNKKPVIYK